MVELENVVKSYQSPGGALCVLKDISLKVDPGQSLAIVGPSGSGKSTLLNMIGALDVPDSGKVSLNGRNIAELDEKALAQVRNIEIGCVFQLHHLLPQSRPRESSNIY